MNAEVTLGKDSILFLCRPEFAPALAEELRSRVGGELQTDSPSPGLLLATGHGVCSVPPLVFERQRMPAPGFVPAKDLKPIPPHVIDEVFGPIVSEHPLWTVHLVSAESSTDGEGPPRKLEGVWNTLLRLARKTAPDVEKRHRAPHRLKPGGLVVQLLLTPEGLWHSCADVESITSSAPGGITRMKMDPDAPSRSYLKVEEALERMPDSPEPGERVIDLGAAPGGWTYAFVKRGCDVLSVDHGPMKLPEPREGWGRMTHVKANGITFEAPSDWPRVDWLVADMLIAPGVANGLLRRWVGSGKAERIICNVKLPQAEPFQALSPILDLLAWQTTYVYAVRQLYHDRREVTVMAWKKCES